MEDKKDKKYPIQTRVPGPRRAKMPLHRSRRWLAEGENGRAAGTHIFLTQQAYLRINAHAISDMDNEVGGWLAGRWCKDTETGKEFVVVEALLPAQQVRSGSTFLTFTHDSQVAMLAALEERYSKKGVVGWYHTHPRMGIFLSGYDTWLHDHFFPHPWQVALVVEPHTGVGGFFVRNKDNKLDPRKYYGFHELQNRRLESVVNWQNLHLEKQKEEVQVVKAEPKSTAEKPQQPKADAKVASPETVVEKKPIETKSEVRKVEVKTDPPKRVSVRKKEDQTITEATTPLKAQEPNMVEVKSAEPLAKPVPKPQEPRQEIKIDVHNKTIVKKQNPKNGNNSSEEAKS